MSFHIILLFKLGSLFIIDFIFLIKIIFYFLNLNIYLDDSSDRQHDTNPDTRDSLDRQDDYTNPDIIDDYSYR